MQNRKIIELTPPLCDPDCIQETITCIRGHRERLFRVEMEYAYGKYIFHNYGQGGAGWTFLFGCVYESIRQFKSAFEGNASIKKQQITVIGAGCYGLLTAIVLAQEGYMVTIVAKEYNDLASQRAAGFFFPRHRKMSTPEERAIFLMRGLESYRTYTAIARGEHSFVHKGAKIIPAYFDPAIDPGFSPYIERGLITRPESVHITFDSRKIYAAQQYRAVFINVIDMLKEFQRLRESLGISIKLQVITHFDELSETIIFNCTGLGARNLTQDKKIVPVQGHLIALKNQPSPGLLDYMLNFKVVMQTQKGTLRDELLYYAPKQSGILGVTFIRGQDSLTANQYEFDRILQRSRDFFGN